MNMVDQELLQKFEDAVYKDAFEGFERLLLEHDEQYYGFYLYSTYDVRYVSIGAFVKGQDDDASSMWSPCDAMLHGLYGFLAEDQMPWVQPKYEKILPIGGSYETIVHAYTNALLRVLQRLDASGVFAKQGQRSSYVLNLLYGDQSEEEMLQYAAKLNPEQVVQRFERELRRMYGSL